MSNARERFASVPAKTTHSKPISMFAQDRQTLPPSRASQLSRMGELISKHLKCIKLVGLDADHNLSGMNEFNRKGK